MRLCILTLLSLFVLLVVLMIPGFPVEGAVEVQTGGT